MSAGGGKLKKEPSPATNLKLLLAEWRHIEWRRTERGTVIPSGQNNRPCRGIFFVTQG